MGPTIPEEHCANGESEPIKIGNHALLGCGTVVLPGVEIPEGMATGAYTILKKMKYKPWTLYAGVEPRELGPRDGAEALKQAERMMADKKYWDG